MRMFERSSKEQAEAEVFGDGYSLQDFLEAGEDYTPEEKAMAYLSYASHSGKSFPVFLEEAAQAAKENIDGVQEISSIFKEGVFQVAPDSRFSFIPDAADKVKEESIEKDVLCLHTVEIGVGDGPLPGKIEIHPGEGFLTYSMEGADEGERYSWYEKASLGEDGGINRIDKCVTLDPGNQIKEENQMRSVVIYPDDGREIHIDQPAKAVEQGDAATARVYGADGMQTSFEKVPLDGKNLDELETDEIMDAIDHIEDTSTMVINQQLSEEKARDLMEEALWMNDEADMHWGALF